MANLTQNITNTVAVLGTTSKWGTLVWGVDQWGEGRTTDISFTKVISNTQTIDQTLSLASEFVRTMSFGTFVATNEIVPRLSNGNWDYVLDLEIQSWSESAVTDATFTCQAAAGTQWSEV